MKTLIILHGWQSSSEKWQKVKEEIEKAGIRVIIPDLPGFKRETELTQPWDLNNYLEWLEEFFCKNVSSFSRPWKREDETTIPEEIPEKNDFFLLGHSFGGRIALKFARKYPQALEGLILVSSAGIRSKINPLLKVLTPIVKIFSFVPGYQFLRRVFYHRVLKKTDYLKLKGALKQTFKNIVNEDLTYLLSMIKVRTLILWGEKDSVTPFKAGEFINRQIENSKLEILKNAGHAPYLENPELLAEKIINFINVTRTVLVTGEND